ncbi:MAG: hypothetical protein NTZ07_00590 [Candidatus Woesebacteria bacterium]|nr:hypothetical protein [Candidatus Woesebacteria bacterium]
MCFFNRALCLPQGYVWIVSILAACLAILIGIVVLGALVKSSTKRQEIQSAIDSQPQERPKQVDVDQENGEEEEYPLVKVGQKILYSECNNCTCSLVITNVNDEGSEVTGYFLVDLPADAKNIRTHYDRDEQNVLVCFDMSVGHNIELCFDVSEDPDELGNSSATITFAEAKALAQPVQVM